MSVQLDQSSDGISQTTNSEVDTKEQLPTLVTGSCGDYGESDAGMTELEGADNLETACYDMETPDSGFALSSSPSPCSDQSRIPRYTGPGLLVSSSFRTAPYYMSGYSAPLSAGKTPVYCESGPSDLSFQDASPPRYIHAYSFPSTRQSSGCVHGNTEYHDSTPRYLPGETF
jgi:hypothetical protein